MKIYLAKIPPEGFVQEEQVLASSLQLDTEVIKFIAPVKVKARINRITNAVTVDLLLESRIEYTCSRCLLSFEIDFNKNSQLNYQVEKNEQVLDILEDIRQEIMLDYPLKPLCKPDCSGLCKVCGKNLNEGGCSCGST